MFFASQKHTVELFYGAICRQKARILFLTPEGGKIRLRVSRTVDQAVIEISDNGPGIAPQERERIFDRFYRALGTKTQGHGLGLAIVKRIVELHQGEIYVDDGLDERGTTMRIELPLAK